ncbi:MAG TPA: heme ABC transporter ATP-binding protein, partial [Anaerolinea sp.]|nr:heme ABC transporter ATP-binding protein [Anaerolinea sp.]
LAPSEVGDLFTPLRAMTAEGKSIIFISHKLHEVMEISERVTVLRRGKVTAAGVNIQGITRADLARLMVGREVIFPLNKKAANLGRVVLSIENVWAEN